VTTSDDLSMTHSSYILDAENAAEMARLSKQHRFITEYGGGLLPGDLPLARIQSTLDVGCGPGSWAIDVAAAHPDMQVTGIDISAKMVEYAGLQAAEERLMNTNFVEMDIRQPLDFPDQTFDLVNARLVGWFMAPDLWPDLIKEYSRILRPGGIIHLLECEFGLTNSPANESISRFLMQALKRAGLGFSPDGRQIGITPMLGRFLRDSSCQNSHMHVYGLDCSYGTPMYAHIVQDLLVGWKLAQPFLLKMGVTTQQEIARLYQLATEEMHSTNFCCLWTYVSVWGELPA
jgi:ubiquinone/menaquinone biosynthesis C-methylase UbiE